MRSFIIPSLILAACGPLSPGDTDGTTDDVYPTTTVASSTTELEPPYLTTTIATSTTEATTEATGGEEGGDWYPTTGPATSTTGSVEAGG